MLSRESQWNYSDQESCSDHRFITFTIAQNLSYRTRLTFRGIKYIVNSEKLEDVDANILREYSTIVSDYNTTGDVNSLDDKLCNMANAEPNASKLVTEYEEIVNAACKANFKTRTAGTTVKNKGKLIQDQKTNTKTDHREKCGLTS